MRNHLLKGFLFVALLLMSRPALAVPSQAELDWMVFSALSILIGAPWFLISAFRAFKRNRSNLISLHVSSFIILFVYIRELKKEFNSFNHLLEQSEDFYWSTGIVITILTVNILAIYTLIKRRQEKEQEKQVS